MTGAPTLRDALLPLLAAEGVPVGDDEAHGWARALAGRLPGDGTPIAGLGLVRVPGEVGPGRATVRLGDAAALAAAGRPVGSTGDGTWVVGFADVVVSVVARVGHVELTGVARPGPRIPSIGGEEGLALLAALSGDGWLPAHEADRREADVVADPLVAAFRGRARDAMATGWSGNLGEAAVLAGKRMGGPSRAMGWDDGGEVVRAGLRLDVVTAAAALVPSRMAWARVHDRSPRLRSGWRREALRAFVEAPPCPASSTLAVAQARAARERTIAWLASSGTSPALLARCVAAASA